MSDALSKFIGGLQSLDPQAAFANFKGLDAGTQGAVLTDLTGKYGTTFDELNNLSEADKARVTQNIKNNRDAFTGVNRAQQTQQPAQQQETQPEARTFEQKWAKQAEQRNNDAAPYHPTQDKAFAGKYGETDASNRHGYQPPHRQAQLARQAAIRSEAERAGVSFGEMADKFVSEGR